MTLDDQHGDLPGHSATLVRRLDRLNGLSAPSRVAQGHHMQYAERCRVLGDHLRGILVLSSAHHYTAAFVLTRTALEHHLLDRLLFLANRWEVKTGIKPADAKAEEARLAALKAGHVLTLLGGGTTQRPAPCSSFSEACSDRGRLDEAGPYRRITFHVDRYDPFTVHTKATPRVAMGFRDQDSAAQWAAESLRTWQRHFKFERLMESLEVNHLLRPRLAVQMYVHYAFLSAFVHGVQKAYERIFTPNNPSRVGAFNHYASELALLYVVAIAAAELEVFGRMAKRSPRLHQVDWAAVEAEIASARKSSSYFWFLSGEPTAYDRIQEVHTRKPMLAGGQPSKRVLASPASLNPSRVRY